MTRLDLLRTSLLLAVTACGPTKIGFDDDSSEIDGDAGTETTDTSADSCPACANPQALANGYVKCADGSINRVTATDVDLAVDVESCHGDEAVQDCSTDADCPGPNGVCMHSAEYCGCIAPCISDSECPAGQACIPGSVLEQPVPVPQCHPADCTSNADCGECGECGLGVYADGCGRQVKLSCRTDADTCRSDDECVDYCHPSAGDWSCVLYEECAVPGRALLVSAHARTAPHRRRTDWAVPFDLPQDAELAAYWANVAALEHASVASFARFGQQLLDLGAPPQLLMATHAAARDEVEHAKIAYGLASAYGGAPVGPGRLNLVGVAVATPWRDVVRGLIQEACVGETLNVAEAMAAAQDCTEPAVCAALERIASDELRHAELAWRCLAWILGQASSTERAWGLALLEQTISSAGLRGGDPGGMHRPADGVLGAAARGLVHRQAIARVLDPVARALRLA